MKVLRKEMHALVKKKPAPGLWLENVATPRPACGEVLLKVLRTSICGTDVHIYNWDDWAQRTVNTPMVIGHECYAEVVGLGQGVTRVQPGDKVSVEGHIVCEVCRNCIAGKRHICASCRSVGVQVPGAFAEYITVPETNLWKHNTSIDPDIAVLFDPLGNAVHACLQWNPITEDVLITGAGAIGIFAVAVARFAGARSITVTDINRQRLQLAQELGADNVIDVSEQNLTEAITMLDIGDGFGVGLEMSGNALALRDMVNAMRYGGNIAMLGIPLQQIPLNWHKLLFAMITIRGVSGRQMFDTWRSMSVMVDSGLDLRPAIAMKLPYKDFQQGFDYLLAGGAGKVILEW